MKNLYKIEDELYIVSNTETISENCWIITSDRLVQVSYLLSDEVAKGFKVILTTNDLLIKNGVQAIDDDFLEWFVKNPSCEEVEINSVIILKESRDETDYPEFDYYNYEIIIPKEEPCTCTDECLGYLTKTCKRIEEEPKTKCYCGHTSYCDCGPLEPEQETLSWDELVKEAGSEEELVKILKLPHIAPLVREAMFNNRKK